MYLKLKRILINLTARQRWVIVITLLLPPIILQFLPSVFPICPNTIYAIYAVWCIFAVVIVASSMNDDRSRMELLVNDKVKPLERQVALLREELDDAKVDYRQMVNDLEQVMREAFGKVGIAPRRRPISLRGKATLGGLEASGTLTVRGGSRMARLRRRVRSLASNFWREVYGEEGSG